MERVKESGFSLVEVIVATAIWSILAMGISYTIVSQKNQAIDAERSLEAIDMGNKLADYVNSNIFCDSVLSSTADANSRRIREDWTPLDIRNTKFTIHNNQTVTAGTQLDANGIVRVTRARFRVKPGTTDQEQLITIGDKEELRRIAQIELELGLFNNLTNERIKALEPRSIDIPVMTKNNFITSCSLKVTEPEICSALGMDFDINQSVCSGEGDLGCDFMGSYTKADIDGDSNLTPSCNGGDSELINSVTGGCSCPAGTNEERSFGPSAVESTSVQCGKKCAYTIYTQYEVIGCFKCGGN